jgi:MFS family permease
LNDVALRASSTRVLTACLAGTTVEFYDFYIYATAASMVFGAIFFPPTTPSIQLLAAYGSFAVAFIARPFGAVVFGHFGDRIGRKSTLVVSLLLMGGSTVAIGLLPSFALVGWLSPVLLCLLRFGQGLGLGGEWAGAVLLAVENAPVGYSARFGMVPQLGAPLGFIAANGIFLLLGLVLMPEQFLAWGWRLPFLASALLVVVGLWVRLRLGETPVFAAALAAAPPMRVPIAEVAKRYPGRAVAGSLSFVACYTLYYLASAFALGYGVTTLGYDRRTFLALELGAIPFMAIGIVLSGIWSDRTSPRHMLIAGCGSTVIIAALFAPILNSGSILCIWIFLSVAMLIMGIMAGPLGSWVPSLFPARVRYTGASIAFSLGGIGGGIAPGLAQLLANHGGLPYVSYYLSGTALVSFVAIATIKR